MKSYVPIVYNQQPIRSEVLWSSFLQTYPKTEAILRQLIWTRTLVHYDAAGCKHLRDNSVNLSSVSCEKYIISFKVFTVQYYFYFFSFAN